MPARRQHKTKAEQEQAARNKHKSYYARNRETILSKKRVKYGHDKSLQSKARKDENEEEKTALWEAKASEEHQTRSLERLRNLEQSINEELRQSATHSYFERLYHEYQAWHTCDNHTEKSPIELPFKLFSSMTNAVAKIGNAILNEYGAGKEWNKCRRLTKRIRYLIQCIDDMECAVLEGNNLLETRHIQNKLLYQDQVVQHWVNRAHARIYAANRRLSPSYSLPDFTEADVEAANRIEAEEARQQEQCQTPAQVSASISGTSTPLNSPQSKRVFQPTNKASPSIRRVAEKRAEQQLAVAAPTHTHTHSVSPAPVERNDSPGPFQSAPSTSTFTGTHAYAGTNPYASGYYQYAYPSYQSGPQYLPAMQPTMQPVVPVQAQHPPPGQLGPPTSSIASPVFSDASPALNHPVGDSLPEPLAGSAAVSTAVSTTKTAPAASATSRPIVSSTAETVLVPTAPHHPSEPVANSPTLPLDATSPIQPPSSQTETVGADQPRATGGGRPSQASIGVLEKLRDEFDERVLAASKATGLTTMYIYDFINKTCKGQRELNTWNKFQPFALDDDNFEAEIVARVADTSCRYPGYGGASPLQIQTAYASFMAEHGEERAKKILTLWHDDHEVEISQTKGSRKRTFNTAVRQVKNMSKTMRNKHSIYSFTLMIGGIIGTDQELSFICEEGESKGFTEAGFLFGPRALIMLFRAYVGTGVAVTYTNNQLAAFARDRGLTISGHGIEDAEDESSPTKGVALGADSTKVVKETPSVAKSKEKAEKVDILAIVKARVAEGIGSFSKKGNTLYWATIAEQCLTDGVQITGYPPSAKYPWSLLKLPPSERSRGIKSMSKDDQDLIIRACNEPKGSEARLEFSRVDCLDLAQNRAPLLVTAPDSNGNKAEVFISSFDGLEAILQKIIGPKPGPKQKVHFKTEDMDVDITPASTPSTPRRARPAARKRKDTTDDGEDFDELESEVSETEDDSPTPRAKKVKGEPSGRKAKASRSKVCSQETVDDSDEMASGTTSKTAKVKAGGRTRTQSSRLANTAGVAVTPLEQPKAANKPSSGYGPSRQTGTMATKPTPPPTLTMEVLRDGDFKPLNLSMKRPAHTADDAASAKKMRPSVSPIPPSGFAPTPTAPSMPQPPPQAPQLPSRVPTPADHYPPGPAIVNPPPHPQPHQAPFPHPPPHPSYWQYPAYPPQQPYPHPQSHVHPPNPSALPPAANVNPSMQGPYLGMSPMLPPWGSMTLEQQAKMQELYNSFNAQPHPSAGSSGQQQ
ncbi:hypothetical protein PM082_000442 [Marasmius tenuissimus]|nr:hypothetical protein PM082_000442 [Marasmius tenuissimus]